MPSQPWNLVFLAGFAIYVAIRHVYSRRSSGQESVVRKIDGLEVALMMVVFVGSLLLPLLYLFTPWLSFADYSWPPWLPWCGAAAMVPALWLFWRSHADLGLNWSVSLEIRKDHRLVQEGVYRRVRHPMYTAIFLFGVAQALLLANWLAGPAAFVTFVPLYVLRRPREERMMLARFGDEYKRFRDATGALLPRLWR